MAYGEPELTTDDNPRYYMRVTRSVDGVRVFQGELQGSPLAPDEESPVDIESADTAFQALMDLIESSPMFTVSLATKETKTQQAVTITPAE